MPCSEFVQAAGENRIIPNVPMIFFRCCEGNRELGHLLEFRCQHLFLHGGPVRHCFTLEAGKGHLANWWARTYVDNPMEPEASEVLGRPGFIGVGDILSSFHIQKQGWHPWKRNHLAALMDLHEDDQSAGYLVTCLGSRGRL